MQGKAEFSELRTSIYREVREEFRPRWGEYFEARKNGGDPECLSALKAEIIADQKAALEPRRDAACEELRESRDQRYREILDGQRDSRAELTWRQDAGLDSAPFFHDLAERYSASQETTFGFREAAREMTLSGHYAEPDVHGIAAAARGDEPPILTNRDVDNRIVDRVRGNAVSFVDGLFSALINLGSAPREPVSRAEREESFRAAADDATKQQQYEAQERSDAEWRQRSKALYGE